MRTSSFLTACLLLLGFATTAQAKTQRRFTLILDFSTCVGDPDNINKVTCQEKGRYRKAHRSNHSNLPRLHR